MDLRRIHEANYWSIDACSASTGEDVGERTARCVLPPLMTMQTTNTSHRARLHDVWAGLVAIKML